MAFSMRVENFKNIPAHYHKTEERLQQDGRQKYRPKDHQQSGLFQLRNASELDVGDGHDSHRY